MTITLYSCTAENNRVSKGSFLTSVLSASGTVTPPCSAVTPTVLIKSSTYPQANYAYIDTYHRYYYITDCQELGGDVWKISMKSDPLMTFGTALRGCTAFILRNQNTHNDFLTDMSIPRNGNVITESPGVSHVASSSAWYGSDSSDGLRYIVTFQGKIASATSVSRSGGIVAFVLTRNSASEFLGFLGDYRSNIFSQKTGYDYLCRAYSIPIAPTTFDVETWSLPGMDSVFTSRYDSTSGDIVTSEWTCTVNSHCGDFPYRAFSPFIKYTLYFSPFGVFDLDPGIIFHDATTITNYNTMAVNLRVRLFPLTGDASLQIKCGLVWLTLATANLAIDLPSTKDAINVAGLVSGLSSTALGAINAYNGNVLSGLHGIYSGISNLSNIHDTSMSQGSSRFIDSVPRMIVSRQIVEEEAPETMGYPLAKEDTLTGYTGFTLCSDVHLEGAFGYATDFEKSEILSACKSGVIL